MIITKVSHIKVTEEPSIETQLNNVCDDDKACGGCHEPNVFQKQKIDNLKA